MKKCKDCGLFGCERRGDGETECFYDIDLQKCKESEEKNYWQSFRAEAAKDILCALITDGSIPITKEQITDSIELADELIKQLKERRN